MSINGPSDRSEDEPSAPHRSYAPDGLRLPPARPGDQPHPTAKEVGKGAVELFEDVAQVMPDSWGGKVSSVLFPIVVVSVMPGWIIGFIVAGMAEGSASVTAALGPPACTLLLLVMSSVVKHADPNLGSWDENLAAYREKQGHSYDDFDTTTELAARTHRDRTSPVGGQPPVEGRTIVLDGADEAPDDLPAV